MERLDAAQIAHVQKLMTLAISSLRTEMMTITEDGRSSFREAQKYIREHIAELHASADRVSQHVATANALSKDIHQKFEEIKQKILEHEGAITAEAANAQGPNGKLAQLTREMNEYADRAQVSIMDVDAAAKKTRADTEIEFGKWRQHMEL